MGHGQIPGGGSGAQVRPLTVTEGVVNVTDVQTVVAAANANRRGLIVQNNGANVVQIYLTTGKAFGAAGIRLTPGTAAVAGDIWSAAQENGIAQGAVYGICDTGNTATVSVTEET